MAPNCLGVRPIAEQGPLKLGIIGFGRIARHYYTPAVRALPRDLRVVVADPLEHSRTCAARVFHKAPVYSDYRHLLEREPLHAVLVATPPSSHLEIWYEAARFGLPVFMEKPLFLPGELDQIDHADPAWQNLMVNFNRRFWPTYQRIAEQVADGSLGHISQAQFTLHVDVAKWSTVTNHRASEREGGVLYDLGSQVFDLLFATFAQRPKEIQARRLDSAGRSERVQLMVKFADGLTVDCDLAYGTRNRESVMVRGSDAVLNLGDPNFRAWVGRDPSVLQRFSRACGDGAVFAYRGIFRSASMLRFSVHASLAAFLVTLRTDAPFSPGFQDALRVARCTEAARRSLEEGRAMSMSSDSHED